VNQLEEDRAWNPLKLQQTESVKDYPETFLQIIVNVGKNFTEKNKLRRHVEGRQDEVRKVIRVGMVVTLPLLRMPAIQVQIYVSSTRNISAVRYYLFFSAIIRS
jgi:hypothetical protein